MTRFASVIYRNDEECRAQGKYTNAGAIRTEHNLVKRPPSVRSALLSSSRKHRFSFFLSTRDLFASERWRESMRLRRSFKIAPAPRLNGLELQQQKRAPAIAQRNVLQLIPWLLSRLLKLSNSRRSRALVGQMSGNATKYCLAIVGSSSRGIYQMIWLCCSWGMRDGIRRVSCWLIWSLSQSGKGSPRMARP